MAFAHTSVVEAEVNSFKSRACPFARANARYYTSRVIVLSCSSIRSVYTSIFKLTADRNTLVFSHTQNNYPFFDPQQKIGLTIDAIA